MQISVECRLARSVSAPLLGVATSRVSEKKWIFRSRAGEIRAHETTTRNPRSSLSGIFSMGATLEPIPQPAETVLVVSTKIHRLTMHVAGDRNA